MGTRTLLACAAQVAIMPCVAMDSSGNIGTMAALACIEYCKTNFENAALNGAAQLTGIYQVGLTGCLAVASGSRACVTWRTPVAV